MVLMEMGMDLEGEELGEVSKCMLCLSVGVGDAGVDVYVYNSLLVSGKRVQGLSS